MDFATPKIIQQGQNYGVSHGDDSGAYVVFSDEAIEDAEASAAAGRPIYKDVAMITIRFPGDSKTVICRPVKMEDDQSSPSDIHRFPRQWEKYKNQQTDVIDGTPITMWPPISKAQALELKSLNIHTVELLAAVSDSNLTWMDARAMRDKAIAYIEQAKNGAAASQWAEEKKHMQNQIDALQASITALNEKDKKNGKDAPSADSKGS